MDTIVVGRHHDQLSKRRKQLTTTLAHLAKEQQEVERNTDWLDQASYKNRAKLLERLEQWYRTEMAQIDKALERIEKRQYGQCLACHQDIENRRLDTAPEAEFCARCQAMREAVEKPEASDRFVGRRSEA